MIEEGPHVGGFYQGCGIHCKLCLRIFIHNMDSKAVNSVRWNIDCFPRENVDLDRMNHVNFFDLCVTIPPCQPNNVNNLHVHRLWRTPKSQVRSKMGLDFLKQRNCEDLRARSQLLALERVEGRAKAPGWD